MIVTVTAKIVQACDEHFDFTDRKGRRVQIQYMHRTAAFNVRSQTIEDPRTPSRYAMDPGGWRVSKAVYYKKDGTPGIADASVWGVVVPTHLTTHLDKELGEAIDELKAKLFT